MPARDPTAGTGRVSTDTELQSSTAGVDDGAPSDAAARRSFSRACALGGGIAAIAFIWMVAIGRLDLLQSHLLDGFYDSQAHALLAGHWDIPRDQLGFEAFVIGNRTYTYFGPWPSLLRMPIEIFTHRFDGRLTQLSLLIAFAVFMVATARLLWRIREVARGAQPVTRAERIGLVVFMLVSGAGSVVLFLASRPVVYHEAELWGAAWAIAAFAAILEFELRPTTRAVVWSGVFTGLALLTRGSVGLGPFVALALVLAGRAWAWWRARTDDGHTRERTFVGPLSIALVVPLALYAYVNEARFGTLFSLPIDKQIATTIDPHRPHIFAGTHGSLFAPKFVPTDLVALLRPNALAFTRVFPYVTFPARPQVLGHITFAAIDPTTSMPAVMPFLFVLAVIGAVMCFRARYAPLRVLAIGGLVGGLGVVTIPFISQRYLSDFMPLLIVLAGAGMYWVLGMHGRLGTGLLVAFALLAAFSVAVNFGLALVYQRAYSPFTDESERAAFVRFERAAPGGSHMPVRYGATLPKPLAGGTLFVLGNCDGVYWSDGAAWHAIERTNATGEYPIDFTVADQPAGARQTLLEAGPTGADRIELVHLGGDRVRFDLSANRLTTDAEGPPLRFAPGSRVHADVTYDTNLGNLDVHLHGREVLGFAYGLAGLPVRAVDPSVHIDRVNPAFCVTLTRRG
jgi:hypothetical protein